jgi:SPOR domain
MAENDQRSYREPAGCRGGQEAPRTQTDDPLAELARLIGQSVPMNKLGRDRRPVAPESADDRRGDHASSYPAPETVVPESNDERYSASEDEQSERPAEADYRDRRDERYEAVVRAKPAPLSSASRFRHEPDFAIEPAYDAADGEASEAATAEWHDASSDEPDSHYHDDYEDERHDDDHAYDDEYGEHQNTGRRGFVFVAAIFALAVLGTAGAFGYRALFGGPALPALPPIIKAEGGPNKIIPNAVAAKDSAAQEADANDAASHERLVSREERPVDIPPATTSTAPRPVSTVPVFPDPPPMGGPGAVVGYSASPSSNPAISTETTAQAAPTAPTAPALTTATAPNPSAVQGAAPAAAASVATTTPGPPIAPAPKKIRTVTIHADSSGATADAVAGSSANVPARPGAQSPQGGNAPLSIVPSSTEASTTPARPRPAPAQPVPLNKPLASETASAAPAAPVATGGSYAVQVSSQRSEEEAQSSFRDLQTKYPNLLGGRTPIIRRADLGAKGIFFRAMVGPFASADEATTLCSNLKAAGGSCLVQKN